MAFALQISQSKRVKLVDQNGREETDDQSRTLFQAAAVAAAQVGSDAIRGHLVIIERTLGR